MPGRANGDRLLVPVESRQFCGWIRKAADGPAATAQRGVFFVCYFEAYIKLRPEVPCSRRQMAPPWPANIHFSFGGVWV